MISLKNITKKFDEFVAVDNLSMDIKNGEVLGFLGPNGAGKSTTMKMITGFMKPTEGIIKIKDMDVDVNPIECKKLIGYLPEGAPLYGDMTPISMLKFVAYTRGMSFQEFKKALDIVVVKTEITDVINQPIDTLSKGYKRRVGLAQALIHDPEILILDEPTDGLDPNQKHHVRELIKDMAAHKAIIVSTHILEEVEAVCSRAVIISHGKLLIDGTPDELMAKAHNHNAVVVSVGNDDADKIVETTILIAGVKGVDHIGKADDFDRFRILPQPGKAVAQSVSDALREANVDVHELYVERGGLDDVFRQITVSDSEFGDGSHA